MPKTIELAPSKIRFMHHHICPRFKNQNSVEDTVNKIAKGKLNVSDLPMIRVVRRKGFYFSFDNRRLYVFRRLQHLGKLKKVKVQLAPLSQFQPYRLSTENNGKSIIFKVKYGETARQHALAESPPSSPET